ncbi:MAG: fatty acid desaturase [Sulfurovaceae bacterium]|nr:fatty acid desaturase [Sulfurovaceae bacterium]
MNTLNHYNELKKQLEENGCFENQSNYVYRFFLLTVVFIASYMFLLFISSLWVSIFAVFILGLTIVQAGFLAHDAGDGSVTKKTMMKYLLPQIYMTCIGGLSFSYFIELHKFHHKTMIKGTVIKANPENEYEFKAIKKLVAFNPILFMIVTIVLRGFTLKIEGLKYLYHNRQHQTDIIFLMGHAGLWLLIPALVVGIELAIINYVLITLVAGTYAGIVLVVNHSGMVTSNDFSKRPFMERVGLTTRNLGETWFSDFIWGGINNHIEHHLYPTIPTSKLGFARKIVREYYKKHHLPYNESNFFKAMNDAKKYFMNITLEARVMEPLN